MQRSKKRFFYTHKIIFTIAALLLIVFVVPYLYWYIVPKTPLAVVVIDKTTGQGYREHHSFFWLLNHWKYVDPRSDEFYDGEVDYYGYQPKDTTVNDVSQLQLLQTSLLYIVDTYGVYEYPMEYNQYERLIPETYVPIKLQYGGINEEEMSLIERYDSLGRMSIAEFNTMQDPQLEVKPVQQRLEKLFGVHFTGALGRYYDDVNSAAHWMKDLYQKQYREKWNFSGRGIIITVKRTLGDERPGIVVLQSGDLSHTPVFIRNSEHPLLTETEDNVPYYYFFEFMELDSSARALATYEIQCNHLGKEKMAVAGLPLSFPAVILSNSEERNIYFAGDFADNRVETLLTEYWNVEFLLSKLFSFYFVSDQTRFFWKFYLPMMKQILHRAADQNPDQTKYR